MVLSVASLFVGVIDIDPAALLSGDGEQWFIFLVSRLSGLSGIMLSDLETALGLN